MSKIQSQLMEATGIEEKNGEDRQDFLKRLSRATADLSDAKWNSLSGDAQNWFNDSADATNAKKPIPEFKDKEETSTRRRTTSSDDEGSSRRGDDDGGSRRRGSDDDEGSSRRRSSDDDKPKGPSAPKVGDTIEAKRANGETITGKVVELYKQDGKDQIAIDVTKSSEGSSKDDLGERAFNMEKLTVIWNSADDKKADKDEGSSRRRSDDDDGGSRRRGSDDDKKDDKKDSGGRSRATSDDGKSVTMRYREICCENLGKSHDECMKIADKEKLEIKDNTAKLVWADVDKTVKILDRLKLMK